MYGTSATNLNHLNCSTKQLKKNLPADKQIVLPELNHVPNVI